MEKNTLTVKAINKNVRTSPRKLSLVLNFIKGKKADVALRDLATKGEIDYAKVGIAGTIGAALGPLTPVVSKIFKKYSGKICGYCE